MDISNYESVHVEYTCEDCYIGNDFDIIFDKNEEQKKNGECSHFDLMFNWKINNYVFEIIVSIHCRKCKKIEKKPIIKDFDDIMANLNYTCSCGYGNLNIGLLFFEKEKQNNNQQNQSEKIPEKQNNNQPNQSISIPEKKKEEIKIGNNPMVNNLNYYSINNHNK